MPEEQKPILKITQSDTITLRPDGSYVLNDIYHILDNAEFHDKYEIVKQAIADGHAVTVLTAPSASELLETAKAAKLGGLNNAFAQACDSATVTMSGIAYDANETANRNVAGLITSMEAGSVTTVQFCAADNSFHELSLAQLKALQLMIIQKGQALYAAKWALRSQIEAAESIVALNAIRISF